MRWLVISTQRLKQTPVKGSAPQNPTAPGLLEYHIQVIVNPFLLNPNSWSLSQPQDFQRSDAMMSI